VPVREEELAEDYVTGPGAIAAHVAVAGGAIIGFQVLSRNPELPAGWADIGTYVSAGARGTGAGAALFAATRAAAARAGVAAINATIRADNRLGLGYYGRMGFSDYAADPDWRLDDGRRVGRVSKRFGIAAG
jgi:GNAT superfamily N-acetyltransferase